MIERKSMQVAIIAPHFQEIALRQANAVAAKADVLLLIDEARLKLEYEDRPMPKAVGVRVLPFGFVSLFDPFRAVWFLCKFRPDTIVIHEPSGLLRAFICAVVVLFMRSFSRIALTVHDPAPHEGRDAKVVKRIGFLRPFVRRWAHVVVVHGEYCRHVYLKKVRAPRQTVVTSLLGVQLTDEPAPPRDRQDGPLRVLAFGRMEEYKGLEVLCAAAEELSLRSVPVSFCVIGQGPELGRLEGRLRHLPTVKVENRYASAARLVRALHETDCVVMPYLSATQSGVLTAAFGNGRFVIASRVGGLPEVLDDEVSGLLVPPGDAKALAAAIERAALNPELRRNLMRGARRTARDRLDWDRLVADIWRPVYTVR